MMEAADETKTTTTTSVTVNTGYPTSWQGVLKIAKCVFLFSCLVCSAILVNRVNRGYDPRYNYNYGAYAVTRNELNYCLAVAVLGFVAELLIFILYIAGANRKWADNAVCGILMMIYHIIMFVMMFAACIIMTGGGRAESRAYNAFGIFSIIGFSLDVYFNFIWIRGGPELAALAIPGQ